MGKTITLEEKIISKREKVNLLDLKISNLNRKRSKLNSELHALEAMEKAKKYEALEISLKNSGITLEEILTTIGGESVE